MITIDAHQHFWKYDPLKHSWINEDMANIRKDFLPAQLSVVLQANRVDGCVAVQAEQTVKETEFLLQLSDQYDFIKGVVGWVDLSSSNAESQLAGFQQFELLKGIRHILQGESRKDYCLDPSFLKGIALLKKYGLTYDILILPDQLQYIPAFVAQFPDQRFVIDHLAKPLIKSGETEDWKKRIAGVASFENVYCKISGMVTEADLKNWQQKDIIPYIDVVVNAFGSKRIMYGSDWPVCLAAADYSDVIHLVRDYFSSFSVDEQKFFFGQNAIDFYQL